MDIQHEIALRMEKVRAVFQYGMSVPIHGADMNLLDKELISAEAEFRSVAYEAAAMRLALEDISNNQTFAKWELFRHGPGTKHLAQVHVGLGWAMAQQQIPVLTFIETLEPLMQFRVMDGYGYYEGVFRKRKIFGEKQLPAEPEARFLPGYDQGIGRSIWYACKGNYKLASELVKTFSSSRHKDLWRGVGTACAYVGGYDENFLKELFAAADHRVQLSVGAALVSRTRADAGSHSMYVDMACRVWCNCSGEEALEITKKTEPAAHTGLDDPYKLWIRNIEEIFAGTRVA